MSTLNIYFWIIKSRKMGWAGHVLCMGEVKNAYKILVGKSEGERPLRRLRHSWEDNIKMDIWAVGLDYALYLPGSG
jgi:hypothetical protein